jgi:hypothetical protein
MQKILNLLKILALASSCWILPSVAVAEDAKGAYSELHTMESISEIMRHLYRWYLDESDFEGILQSNTIEYHVTPVELPLDTDDKSLYADIIIPSIEALVRLKKTDYRIEELDVSVSSDRFKIVNVEKIEKDHMIPDNAMKAGFPTTIMLDYLIQTRNQKDPLNEALSQRLGEAVSSEMQATVEELPDNGDFTIFISPLSPVANEIWVFWQDANLLIRWASDIELDNAAVWEHEQLATKVIDIEEQVVLSLNQVPGSNAYMSRDQIGRILYNCVILGEKRQFARGSFKNELSNSNMALRYHYNRS